jgi:hypothetical protein
MTGGMPGRMGQRPWPGTRAQDIRATCLAAPAWLAGLRWLRPRSRRAFVIGGSAVTGLLAGAAVALAAGPPVATGSPASGTTARSAPASASRLDQHRPGPSAGYAGSRGSAARPALHRHAAVPSAPTA